MATQTITSLQHPIVKRLVKLRTDQRFRYAENAVVIEGIKPVQEVCETSTVRTIVASSSAAIPQRIVAAQVYIVNEQIMHKISGMQSPEGLIAEVTMPTPSTLETCSTILALDRINDPANMGMLLRTALALGWEGVFILKNSCDPYNDKALRTARGATFRLPLRQGTWNELQQIVTNKQLQPLVADIKGQDPETIVKQDKRLLVLGNEAQGPSAEALSFCQKISIPMSETMESLNVAIAGGILMYLLRTP